MKVLSYPDPLLLKKTKSWSFENTSSLFDIVGQMHEVLASYDSGAALAANQVGLDHSIFVIKPSLAKEKNIPDVIINPMLIEKHHIDESMKEGCLSFYGEYLTIFRPKSGKFLYYNAQGDMFTSELDGFIARVFFHEMEHLEGEVFLKNVSSMTRKKIIEKFK